MRRRSRKAVAAPAALALVAGWFSASPAVSQEGSFAGGAAPGGAIAAGLDGGTTGVAEGIGISGASGVVGTLQVAPNTGGITPAAGDGGAPPTNPPATGNPPPPGAVPGLPGGAPGGSTGVHPGGSPTPGGSMPGYGFGTPLRADNIAQLIANAMSRNPDISVAEAKVRSAQTELDRTRLDVSRQIVDTVQTIRFSQKAIEIAKAQVAQMKEQQQAAKGRHETGVGPASEVTSANIAARESELALIKAEASLEATMATLDYLIGGQGMPGGMGMMPGMGGIGMGGAGMMGSGLSGGGGAFGVIGFEGASGSVSGWSSAAGGSAAPGTATDSPPNAGGSDAGSGAAPAGAGSTGAGGRGSGGTTRIVAHDLAIRGRESTYHERLRKKLAEPTTIDFVETPLADVMRYLDDLHGITNIIIDAKLPNERLLAEEPITLKLERVPLSAALKALEDTGNVQFVVTEYGLRVTTKDVKIEESTPLRQFLRPVPVAGMFFLGTIEGGSGQAAGGAILGGGSEGAGEGGSIAEVPAAGGDSTAPAKEEPDVSDPTEPQPRSK